MSLDLKGIRNDFEGIPGEGLSFLNFCLARQSRLVVRALALYFGGPPPFCCRWICVRLSQIQLLRVL